jgi:hypothetical protein
MNIYEKLLKARDLIKTTKVKKEGKNTYSGYEYFTPSQISQLVHSVCIELNLIFLFKLENSEFGYMAKLYLCDVQEPEKGINWQIPTAIPEIKATNAAQQLGGAVTYSERYLLMIAFDIVDNSLDFDTTENTKKTVEKEDKIQIITGLTDKFFDNFNGEILPGNIVELKGRKFKLSDEANKQLRDYLDQLEMDVNIQKNYVKK